MKNDIMNDFIHKKISNVIEEFIPYYPFFAEFLLRFTYIRFDAIETIGVAPTADKIIVYYNKDFCDNLTYNELKGVLVHEIFHLLTISHSRANWIGCYDDGNEDITKNSRHKLFNIASDICINEQIKKDGTFILPKNAWHADCLYEYGYKGKLVAEEVYEFLYNGGNGLVQKIMQGGGFDNHVYLNQRIKDFDKAKEYIKDITRTGIVKGYSKNNLYSSLEEYIKIITRSKINWKRELKNLLLNMGSNIYYSENTWKKINRKHDFLMGKKQLGTSLIIAIDTSGSISLDELEQFFTEIEDIISKGFYNKVYLIMCDAEIQNELILYKRGMWRNLKIKGLGGTNVQPVFNLIVEKKLKKYQLIYFTDGEFSYDFNTHGIKTIWACTSPNKNIPHGKNVYIEVEKT